MRMTIAGTLLLLACTADAKPAEVLVGGPCEGCDAVFVGRPGKLATHARIAPVTEPGEPFVLEGTVTTQDGTPAAGVIVYAYHTDAKGEYPPMKGAKHEHGRLRGFAVSDAKGAYAFSTIRPASYPNSRAPQHVHMHVVEPGRCHYYIDELVFSDDPHLTAENKKIVSKGRGGEAIATPTRDAKKVWHARRDIALGAGIDDYARCGAR